MGAAFILIVAKATALSGLTVAAVVDLHRRVIPNGAVLAVAGAGLVLRLWDFDGEALAISAALAFLLLAGLGQLARRGIVGGGDAKLIAAVSLLQPAAAVPTVLIFIALAGGVLAVVYLMRQWLYALKPAISLRGESRAATGLQSLPYAVAIGLGVLSFHIVGGIP